MARIDPEIADMFFNHGVDLKNRTLWLGSLGENSKGEESGVEFGMAERCIKGLYLLGQSDDPIKIILMTPGGCEYGGMAIYDAIRNCESHVTIIGIGKVWSMGAYILQAGDERVLAPNCTLMYHSGDVSYTGHPSIVRNWVKFETKLGDRLDNILMEKAREKNPDLREKTFKELNWFDHIMTAEEAVDFGLADRIMKPGEISNPLS